MKGFVFTVKFPKSKPLAEVQQEMVALVESGTFAVRMEKYSDAMMATLADYMTMRPGDRVFFFARRCLYGIGELVAIDDAGNVAFERYEESLGWPWPGGGEQDPPSTQERVGVRFHPRPVVYQYGLDMDDVLAANGSENALGLRFMDTRSFHQLTHVETRWLCDLFELRLGREHVTSEGSAPASKGGATPKPVVMSSVVATGGSKFAGLDETLNQENALHALVAEKLRQQRPKPGGLLALPEGFASLDLFHEFWASPPKPPVFADKIDLLHSGGLGPPFAEVERPLPSFFDVYELKKDAVEEGGLDRLLLQGMKYVDFMASTFAANDYRAIRLTFITHGYPSNFAESLKRICRRQFIVGFRSGHGDPNHEWSNVRLLSYRWDGDQLGLTEVFHSE